MSSQHQNYKDPGWNDPPLFSYEQASAIQASATKKGTLLNKRVAFPLSGGNFAKQNTNTIDPTMPQKPLDFNTSSPPTTNYFPKSMVDQIEKTEPEDIPTKIDVNEVLNNLNEIKDIEEGDEISKRLKVMETMWNDNKLDGKVQQKMLELSQVLKDGNPDAADEIHKCLMVDYVTQCSSWMGGIRHLILHVKTKS